MQYAIDKNNNRIEAIPNTDAICSLCKSKVIAKCGSINVHHWAHQSLVDCDSWYEPESEWHRNWKNWFKPEQREVVIGRHRADIKAGTTVIELQNSSISAKEIAEREDFYGDMIWIINAKDFVEKNFFTYKRNIDDDYFNFKWSHPRKCWWNAKRPIYLDIGASYPTMLFRIKKIHPNLPCRGWGVYHGKEYLLSKFLGIKESDIDVNNLSFDLEQN